MKKYSFLLLSGGVGSRINIGKPKQYAILHGIPMIMYSILAIKDIDAIDKVIINYPEKGKKMLKKLIKSTGIDKKIIYVKAGDTRQQSVYRMLKHASSSNVIIHEAARPIVDKSTFMDLINSKNKNCGYMAQIPFTVAPVDPETNLVTGSLERGKLRNVLLPQKFDTTMLKKAHKKALKNNMDYTEDACLFVESGEKFYFIDSSDTNIKVTYRSDLILAESLLGSKHSNEDF